MPGLVVISLRRRTTMMELLGQMVVGVERRLLRLLRP
jgi:hypothetical protein